MQLSYQAPMLQEVAWNGNFVSDWFRVPLGSYIRLIAAVTAAAGAPAGTIRIDFMNHNGDAVIALTLGVPGVGSYQGTAALATEFIRLWFNQAGGVNTVTISADLIIQPPDSTPA